MDKDYSKREIDQHFIQLTDKITEVSSDLARKIDDNTTLTRDLNTKVGIQNGRVVKSEVAIENLQKEWQSKWKGFLVGASLTVFLVGVIISLVVYSFKLSLDNQRQQIMLEINEHIK